jgi:outer membrane biosynthesis protein TonB
VFSRLETVRLLSRPLLALLLLAALATGLSACGSGGGADLLPGTTASQINSNLDQVQQLVAEGECVGATDAADQVTAEVDEVAGVDAKLKQLLVEGAERLEEVVRTCEESEEQPLETTEEQEPEEEDEKAGKHEKPEKEKPPKEEEPPAEPPEPPGQEGEKGKGEGPPEEGDGGTQSGGVGPGQEAGGD